MKRILMVAGESSGDRHASEVVAAYKRLYPQDDAYFYGIAGPYMREQGVASLFDLEMIAVMGLVEVFVNFKTICKAYQLIKAKAALNPPDVVLLIDYSGFNLRLARALKKKHDCPIVYYISPKVWAWKKGRIKTIQHYVDHMAVIFPFEETIYNQAGVNVTYVGSPYMEQLDFELTPAQARSQLGMAQQAEVVGLLPGSRISEINRHMPVLVEVMRRLQTYYPQREWQFVIPLANTLPEQLVRSYLDDALPVKISQKPADQVLKACNVSICASGTVTLEAALLQVPTIVLYRMSALTFAIAKRVVDLPYASLANIVAEKSMFPEYLQDDATDEAIACHVVTLLDDTGEREQQLQDMQQLYQRMNVSDTGANVAQILNQPI